jgi:hypothetical protein
MARLAPKHYLPEPFIIGVAIFRIYEDSSSKNLLNKWKILLSLPFFTKMLSRNQQATSFP